uniref:NAC domain-containing protein n=1 Tax=Steinernema glaseri TaxID=37863 RepID=A0A1I7ZZS9_9BILA
MVEVITFDKLCIRCHREKELKEKEEAAAAEAAAANAAIAAHRMHEHVHSVHSSASSMMLVDGSLPNPSEAVYSDVLMGIHDSDANDDGVLDSVVRDFGLDDRDLSDMLAQMPVEVDDDMGDLGHDYMDSMHHGAHDSLTSGLTMNHDWCDVEEFLDAEGWKSDLGSL